MTVGQELTYYLNELRNSNLLSSGRAVSDFLRESAENAELLEFIATNAEEVSLKEQLQYFAATRSMPEDPRVCLPFAYALLYLLDSGKISAEDLTSGFYPGADAFDAYPLFFKVLADAIEVSLMKADSEAPCLGAESSEFSDEEINADEEE